ncbi:MAG: Uma2 family endonuclease [Candidatus Viridilinea halotolerans]|uniref:Uma2 family endonuclease n=1 Tax=Candidatus Viridilinea halotolerans TaxID=2491704 RepID=A0A426U4K6_9CHLR|nr:MAG: Uma2 family endonuclease [Candidatus Viridilinea halotolerans]
MDIALRWSIADLEVLPANGNRYELIDGELFVSKAPHWHHQATQNRISFELTAWSLRAGGGIVLPTPGIVYAEDEAVIPDLVWISAARRQLVLGPDGKLLASPELVVEVLSFGGTQEARDREAKRRLYSRRGVLEYWIADWRTSQLEIYRRQAAELRHVQTLLPGETLTSPLLPDFAVMIDRFFEI